MGHTDHKGEMRESPRSIFLGQWASIITTLVKCNVRRKRLGLQCPGEHLDSSEQSRTIRDGIL